MPELCSGRTKAEFVKVEPCTGESTLGTGDFGAFTTTLAVGVLTEQDSGKTRSQIAPWHRKVN
jgi:hypothetical protein